MVGQVVKGQMAGLAWGELAISRLAKGFVATAAVKFVSIAMMTAPAMMSQASAQPFTQALVFGDGSVDSGFYKVLGNPNGIAANKFNIAFAAAIAAGGTGAPTNSLLGAAITTGTQTPGFDLGGKFKQKEIAGSIYGGYLKGPSWASVIEPYGALDYDVNRIVPIGITLQNNNGETSGSNISVAFQGGHDFAFSALTHGPAKPA